LSKSGFLANLIKLTASFLIDREFSLGRRRIIFAPREIRAEKPQYSVLALVLYSLFKKDASAASGTHFSLFTDETFIYVTEKHQRPVCKLQCGVTAVKSWCKRWSTAINEGKSQAIP
jgi:hypothetical protein